MKTFKLLLPNGSMVNERTTFKTKDGSFAPIKNENNLCNVMKNIWKKETDSESFTEWAKTLNESGEFKGEFTKYDALDNLASLFHLNIDEEVINVYDFFLQHKPMK